MIMEIVLAAAVLTFNAQPPGRNPSHLIAPVDGPVVIEGWRFTPTTWNAWIIPDTTEQDDKPWMYTSPWMAFDSSVVVTVDGGGTFDLTGFDSTGLTTTRGLLTSSNGDRLRYRTRRNLAIHYDVLWSDLEWIRFDYDYIGYSPNGLDNLAVEADTQVAFAALALTVDEPGSAILIGLGGLMLFVVLRRRLFAIVR